MAETVRFPTEPVEAAAERAHAAAAKDRKILVAMSGGVDSSVAAYLLQQEGFDCIGVTMRLFDAQITSSAEDGGAKSCCSLDDAEDAHDVARRLGFPHHVFNFTAGFRACVIDRFIRAYETGATPNPCIDCNRFLKFDQLYERARVLGCSSVATGHYAVIERDKNTGRYLLKKAVDPDKDQSYVLYHLTQKQLSRTRFPLGGMTKGSVRALAERLGFVNASKPDSQDICFVKGESYADFISRNTGKDYPPGDFVDTSGRLLGRHRGIIRYTVGQRKGLGLALPEPMYVCAINPENNTVVLGKESELYTTTLTANDVNLIAVDRLDAPVRLRARVRYRQAEKWATVEQTDQDTLRITFDEPQRAVTKGQSVVLYDGDTVFGGGTITASES